jgi:hypothetical protein
MRIYFDYLWFVLSIIGILYSLNLIYEASQPCYSDDCLIRLLAVPAIILFLFCAVVFYFSFRNVKVIALGVVKICNKQCAKKVKLI